MADSVPCAGPVAIANPIASRQPSGIVAGVSWPTATDAPEHVGGSWRATLILPSAPAVSDHATYGKPPTTAMLGAKPARVGTGLDVPPTETQFAPSKRRTTTWVVVVAASDQVAYGTPPTSAIPGVKAVLLLGFTLSTPPAETQPVPSNRLTRIWSMPLVSRRTTNGTPPMPAMLGRTAPLAASTLSA